MGHRIIQIDEYIEKAQPFAQPVLNHFREMMHAVCTEVTETIKWGMPHFDYKGNVASMAAFKAHCVVGFRKGALLKEFDDVLQVTDREAMGHLGRIASINELPEDEILSKIILTAWQLNHNEIKLPRKDKKVISSDIPIPAEFKNAIDKSALAQMNFEKFSPSYRKDYIFWIDEAKTDATRAKRIKTAIEWIEEGKGRNWKYEKKTGRNN